MPIRPDDLTPTIAPPDPNPKTPKLKLPPLACDSHFHVFGPHRKFPYAPDRPFTPTDAPKEDLFRLHEFLGIQRGVFVHSTCHGSDHSVLVDLLTAAGGRYRGVALLKVDMPAAEIMRLDGAGVRGIRLHFHFAHLGAPMPRDDMRKIIAAVAPYGWHVAMHLGGQGVVEHYNFIASVDAPVVIDHIGRVDVAEGLNGAAFSALRRLLDRGNVWVKLSGTDRITKQKYPYADAVPFARTLVQEFGDRVVWGSDWPHPNQNAVPNDGELVDLIAEIAPDANTRQLMLVDNPAKLFGF